MMTTLIWIQENGWNHVWSVMQYELLEVSTGHWLLWLVTKQTQHLMQTDQFWLQRQRNGFEICNAMKWSARGSCHHLMQLNGMLVFPFRDNWCTAYLACGEQVINVLSVRSSATSGMSAVTQARHRLSHTHTHHILSQSAGTCWLLYWYKQVRTVTTSWLTLVIRRNVWSQKMMCWCA